LHASAFAAAGVARPIGIVTSGAFSATGECETDAITIDARPGDVSLIAGHVDAEEAVGGVVRLNRRGHSHGGNNAKCGLNQSTAFHYFIDFPS